MGENVHEYDGVLFDDDFDDEYEEIVAADGIVYHGAIRGPESSSEDEFLELPFNDRSLYRH